ncbi:phosphotransferase [Saccharothrix carnea]|uniref:phosphotransferase n=1 Tax=Saccharothrix carnea TaxID=1280637 RepID=UPI0015E6DFF0|nr:phosphotransferase [Saccharothrix carnea]
MAGRSAVREVGRLARRLGLPGDDPEVLKDGYNLLVRLRPAPVVARVATVTAVVRADVFERFRRADELSRFLAGRGVPVVEPHGPGPVRHAGLVVAFARHVEHDPDRRPDRASFTAMLAELHGELRHYPGELPERGPLTDLDAALSLLGRPADLVAARDALAARWPEGPAQALHGDSHARNVLVTASGPVWNDFEDAWHGPVGWDVACAHGLFDEPIDYPAADVPFWLELRALYGVCWTRVRDLYRTRTLPRP